MGVNTYDDIFGQKSIGDQTYFKKLSTMVWVPLRLGWVWQRDCQEILLDLLMLRNTLVVW